MNLIAYFVESEINIYCFEYFAEISSSKILILQNWLTERYLCNKSWRTQFEPGGTVICRQCSLHDITIKTATDNSAAWLKLHHIRFIIIIIIDLHGWNFLWNAFVQINSTFTTKFNIYNMHNVVCLQRSCCSKLVYMTVLVLKTVYGLKVVAVWHTQSIDAKPVTLYWLITFYD